ncbi:hypothetical protein V8G54_024890 [Vigna mungo]|uniref:Reverse transcriptase Ty1/copia-type domain-containing protein n=1 Tax=Vigna mungo TaxID=3915 RepID=A0AAQ3RTJ1_VIGMU
MASARVVGFGPGFPQKQGLDFYEVFALVARIKTIRLLDVKSAFLHEPLEEEVYDMQPPRFIEKDKKHQIYRLQKAFYGLRQAPRAWNKRIDSYLISLKFSRCAVEHGVYVNGDTEMDLIIICLYVDDLLVTGSNPVSIDEFKKIMEAEFEMIDLEKLNYFLGMEFTYTTAGLVLHQRKYAGELLKRLNMKECNAARSPMEANLKLIKDESEEDADETKFKQIIGSLRFLCSSRPDLALCVGVISRFMSKPNKVLWYIKGTKDYGILFPAGRKKTALEITGYTDSDYGGDPVERKSTSGYIFMLNNALISWCSKKKPVVYTADSYVACQGVWLKELIKELKVTMKDPIQLKIDNVSAISLAKNPEASTEVQEEASHNHFESSTRDRTLLVDFAMASVAIIIVLFQQTHGAQDRPLCAPSSCGKIRNISYPFRLKGDSPGCGLPRYELDCVKNVTVFTLFSGKYHVQNIDYETFKIQLTDAGVVEDTACSIPRYSIFSQSFAYIVNPSLYATDPLTIKNPNGVSDTPPSVAFLNCTDPVTDDSRYVEVNGMLCDSRGYVYAVLYSSEFKMRDIKVGCHLIVATFENWNNGTNVSYVDIHEWLHNGFWLSWALVKCIDQCGKGVECSINQTTNQIECYQSYCEVMSVNFGKGKCGIQHQIFGYVIGTLAYTSKSFLPYLCPFNY